MSPGGPGLRPGKPAGQGAAEGQGKAGVEGGKTRPPAQWPGPSYKAGGEGRLRLVTPKGLLHPAACDARATGGRHPGKPKVDTPLRNIDVTSSLQLETYQLAH